MTRPRRVTHGLRYLSGVRPTAMPVPGTERGPSEMNCADLQIEEGSGTVFADLGLPNAAERLTKADPAMQIAGRSVGGV